MFSKMKKRSLFYLGAVLTGLAGIVGSYFGKQYSKEDSLLVSSAHADVAPWAWGFGDGGGVGGGDGSGGCSDGDSGGDGGGGDSGGDGDGDGGDSGAGVFPWSETA
jgi:hypothetical protein